MHAHSLSRRDFIKKSGLSLLVLNLFSCSNILKSYQKKPNFIFFIADDMRPEMFNFLPEGKNQNLTPNLDRLAREGTIMMNQYVVSPVCTPSRYNCLTGRYASRSNYTAFKESTKQHEGQTVVQWNSFITEQDDTIAKQLKKAGYKTGFVGKNHVIQVDNLYRFPSYDMSPRNPEVKIKLKENAIKLKSQIQKCGFDYAENLYHSNPNYIGLTELAVQNMDWVVKGGLDFIDQNKNHPFFLYFASTVPHGPNEKDRSWNADPLNTPEGYLDQSLNVLPPRHTIAERLKDAGIQGENKENLLWLDDALGALLKKLEEHGVDNNTIIFFFNDHGQQAKGTLYQGGVYNPSLVWKKGGFKCGSLNKSLVSNIDFAPTILDFAGVSYEDDSFDGCSFKSALYEKSIRKNRSLYFELGYSRGVLKDNWKYIAIRYPEYTQNMSENDRRKLLEDYNKDRRYRNMRIVNEDNPDLPFSHVMMVPGGGDAENESYGKNSGYFDADQLYDLTEDPHEQKNLAYSCHFADKLSEMQKELQFYLNDLPGEFNI